MFVFLCAIEQVQPHLTQAKQKQMTELQQKLSQLSLQRQPSLSSSDAVSKRDEQEQMRNDLDDIIAAECVYCGEIMIK